MQSVFPSCTYPKKKRPSHQANQGPNMSRILPKAQATNVSGQNSNTGEVQANVVTDQGKAVVGRLHLGAATPWVGHLESNFIGLLLVIS